MTGPISLANIWARHKADVLAPRDDGTVLHASDLHACEYALYQRLSGVPQLPFDDGSFANFERGHAVEARIEEALTKHLFAGMYVTRGEEVSHEGIVGNLDFVLYAHDERGERPVAVIDLSTTAKKKPDWQYGHALKSAFYAVAKGCDTFCEWVFCFGFGGLIVAQQEHWFRLDDVIPGMFAVTWREAVARAIEDKQMLAAQGTTPLAEPPVNPLEREPETWRCGKPGSGKSYCQARCPRNAAYDSAADEVEFA